MKEEKKVEQNLENEVLESEPKDENKIEAIEIHKLREEKKGSTAIIIVFFIILAIAIIGIPYIKPLIEKLTGNTEEFLNPNKKDNDNDKKDDEVNEVKYYSFDTQEVLFEDLKLTNFSLTYDNGYIMTFTASSNINSTIYLLDKNYYIEIYDEDKTLLERIKFYSEQAIYQNHSQTYKFEIGSDTYQFGKEFAFIKKAITDYPEIDYNPNENFSLTCIKGNDKYVYTFNETLSRVENTEQTNRNDYLTTYDALLSSRRNQAASMNNYDGVSSTLLEAGDGFVVSTIVEMKDITSNVKLDYKFYDKDTLPKTVKFEMESMRYTCK